MLNVEHDFVLDRSPVLKIIVLASTSVHNPKHNCVKCPMLDTPLHHDARMVTFTRKCAYCYVDALGIVRH